MTATQTATLPGIAVQLPPQLILEGAIEGVRRRYGGLIKHQPRYGAEKNGVGLWDQDINAACAELAFASWIGEAWTAQGQGPEAEADVGACWQVRWTPYADGCLIVHKSDAAWQFYVLVTGWDGQYALRGWMAGSQAKDDKYWRYRGVRQAAYFVPQNAPLHAMEELLG